MNLTNCVKTFLSTIPKGKILVALSGGADSVCLLLVLKDLHADVCAFHLNHCIRGEEAYRDAMFCKTLCEKHGISFYCESADVPEIARVNGLGIEEAARNVRYQLLEATAHRIGAEYIATAHTADDNVETVIYNIIRGSSVDGACGIPRMRGNIIRPLIDVGREEIEEYLRQKNETFVTDSTNSDQTYTRNRIRHSVVPILKEINPSLNQSIANFCESASRDKEYFEGELNRYDTVIPCELPMSVLTRQIVKRFNQQTGSNLSNVHVNEIAKFVKERKCVTLDLPGKTCAYISYGGYTFKKRVTEREYLTKIGEGLTEIPETSVNIFFGNENVYKLSTSVTVDCDKIIGGLYARQRLPGDRITIFGVSKSLRKELINKKIPLCDRADIPVVCDDAGIVYVPYIGAADRVFSKSGQYTLGLLYSETEKNNEEK